MADEHEDHEEDVITEQYYKLAPGRSIFHDPSQEKGKLLAGQVVKLEPTERVALAFRAGHIETATEAQFKKYEEKVKKEATERAAKAAPATAAAAPTTPTAAQKQADKIIADAQKEATKITQDAEKEAEKIKADAAKPQA
jgi:hypothetical protein